MSQFGDVHATCRGLFACAGARTRRTHDPSGVASLVYTIAKAMFDFGFGFGNGEWAMGTGDSVGDHALPRRGVSQQYESYRE